jgi:cytochrome o ubiquinol oxidase subunit 3
MHGAAHGHDHGHDDHHHDSGQMTVLGFWLYLMTDCILFASLFATYAVLSGSFAGGPSGHDIFQLDFVLLKRVPAAVLDHLRLRHAEDVRRQESRCTGLVGCDLPVRCRLHRDGNLRVPSPDREGYGPQRSGFLSASSPWSVPTVCT